jgi:plasmid replication initiation protein
MWRIARRRRGEDEKWTSADEIVKMTAARRSTRVSAYLVYLVCMATTSPFARWLLRLARHGSRGKRETWRKSIENGA